LTCLASVTLPGAYAPASIALEVIRACKPPYPQHVLRQGGSPWVGVYNAAFFVGSNMHKSAFDQISEPFILVVTEVELAIYFTSQRRLLQQWKGTLQVYSNLEDRYSPNAFFVSLHNSVVLVNLLLMRVF
jgi:hypothetical protein